MLGPELMVRLKLGKVQLIHEPMRTNKRAMALYTLVDNGYEDFGREGGPQKADKRNKVS